MSAWSTWVCDTITGAKLLQLIPITQPFSRKLNAMGSGTSTFQLAKGDGIPWGSLMVQWARTVVICRNDIPVYAGVINAENSYDQTTQQLTVPHADIRTILANRYPFGLTSYWANTPTDTIPGQLVCTNVTWRAIAAAAITQGTNNTLGFYTLPIIIPSPTEVGTVSMTYPNYNFLSVADVINQVQTLGCDIDFQPGWSGSNTLQWTMRTATPPALTLTGSSFEFNQTSPKPSLTNVKYVTSGSKQLTGQFTVGTGSEQDMVVGGIGLGVSATIPAIERVDNEKTATTAPLAAAYSAAALAAYATPTKQWSFTMQAGDPVAPVENLLLGSAIKMWFQNDPLIPDGWSTVRLIGFSGDLTENIVPAVQ